MTFRVKPLPNIGIDPRKFITDNTFDQIFQTPRLSDVDALQNFCTIRDVYCDPATMTVDTNVLDGNGKVSFDIIFFVDSEAAVKANVRKVRFKIYNRDPGKRAKSNISAKPGTVDYHNERFEKSMTMTGQGSGKSSGGTLVSNSRGASLPNCNEQNSAPSKVFEPNDGIIKEIITSLAVSDSVVAGYYDALKSNAISVRQFFNSYFSFEKNGLSQNYEVNLTPKISVQLILCFLILMVQLLWKN